MGLPADTSERSTYQLHGDEPSPAPRATRRWRLVVGALLVVCASLGVGFAIGWEAKQSSNSSSNESAETLSKASTRASESPCPSTVTSTNSSTGERTRYVFIGDSITELAWATDGFTDLLQTTFNDTIEVINHGRSGYTTVSTLEYTLPDITEQLTASPAPKLIAVWLGNNDAAILGGNYEHAHVPLDEFKTNMVTILTKLRNLVPQARLLLITPSVIDDATRRELLIQRNQTYDPIDRSLEQAGLYADVCREIAADMASDNVSLLDIYTYFTERYPDTSNFPLVLEDGLHYNRLGHREVFEQITLHMLKQDPLAFA